MRISDWSSDVCSSDLIVAALPRSLPLSNHSVHSLDEERPISSVLLLLGATKQLADEWNRYPALLGVRERPRQRCNERMAIGRASCREGVLQYVSTRVGAVPLKKKK